MLHHPGIFRTEKYIKYHLTWPGMRTDIEQCIQNVVYVNHVKIDVKIRL
jgi:hypothetical protein